MTEINTLFLYISFLLTFLLGLISGLVLCVYLFQDELLSSHYDDDDDIRSDYENHPYHH